MRLFLLSLLLLAGFTSSAQGVPSPWGFWGTSTAISQLENTVAPAITGTDSFVNTQWTTDDGTWNGSPTSFTYQWQRDAGDISGATSNTYTLTVDDVDAVVTCVVTAHKSGVDDISESSNATSTVDYPTIGTIFNYTSFSSLSDFTNAGSGISLVSNYVQMTSGGATFNDKLKFNLSTSPHRYTALEDWRMRIGYRTPTSISGSSYGIGPGVDSDATEEYSTSFRWVTDNSGTPTSGRVVMYTKRTTNNQVVSSTGFTPVAATDYIIYVTRAKNVFTFEIWNSSETTQHLSVQFTTSLTSGALVQPHNTGRFSIQNFGGTNQRITSWSVTSTAKKYTRYVAVGDSNMIGMFAGSISVRYFEQVMAARSYIGVTLAGIADRSGDVLLRVPEIIALHPQVVYLNILSNDIANGVSSGTYQSNYNSILSNLSSGGITVFLGTPAARSGVNLTAAQTFINGKANTKVDIFAGTKQAGNTNPQASYISGDGIHYNVTGNNAMATLLLTIIP